MRNDKAHFNQQADLEFDVGHAGLRIWVAWETKMSGDADAVYPHLRATCWSDTRAGSSETTVDGELFSIATLRRFHDELIDAHEQLNKGMSAALTDNEPEFFVEVEVIDGRGHMKLTAELTPNYTDESHRVSMEFDQTQLRLLIDRVHDLFARLAMN